MSPSMIIGDLDTDTYTYRWALRWRRGKRWINHHGGASAVPCGFPSLRAAHQHRRALFPRLSDAARVAVVRLKRRKTPRKAV